MSGEVYLEADARVVNAQESKKDFEDRQFEKEMRTEEVKKRKADPGNDGDQDDRFVNPGASSSSAGNQAVQPAPQVVPSGCHNISWTACFAKFGQHSG